MLFVAMQMSCRPGLVSTDGQHEHCLWYNACLSSFISVAPIRAPAVMRSRFSMEASCTPGLDHCSQLSLARSFL